MTDDAAADRDADDGQGNVAGTIPMSGAVEPQQPRLENAVFVVVGAYLAILASLVLISPGGVPASTMLAVTVGVALLALALFGVFGLLDPIT
ncbi:MAG: hypothetical protein ABEJ89_04540 [Haloarculaceae archaeon]